MARNPHEATAQAGGKQGYSGGTHGAYGDGKGTTNTTGTTGTKKTITTGDGVKNLSLVGSIFTGNVKGVIGNIASRFMPKPKTEKEKSEAYTKKGFDVLNPNEMKAATYKPVTPPLGEGGGDGMAQITLNTQSVASTAIPETKSGWGFKAYDSGSTANTRLYGKKGKMVKANQGQFSQGKRFGPPPTKGPDPQGINAPLNSIDYFKDLL